MSDSRDFVNTVKMDVFADEVFVFTPRGDVIDLPVGAVPIDFAYVSIRMLATAVSALR